MPSMHGQEPIHLYFFKKMVYENVTKKKKGRQSSFCNHIKMLNDLSGGKQFVVFLVVHVLRKNYHAETSLIHTPSTKCFKLICTHISHMVKEVNTLFLTHIQSLLRVYYSRMLMLMLASHTTQFLA